MSIFLLELISRGFGMAFVRTKRLAEIAETNNHRSLRHTIDSSLLLSGAAAGIAESSII